MHREEAEQLVPCAGCGAVISPGPDRGYAFGLDRVLCWQCATDRGGSYDSEEDRWTVEPRVADLRSSEPREE